MADFKKSFDEIIKFEGEYSNDPDDLGGETFMGISRIHHPDWAGWGILKNEKIDKNSFLLVDLVKNFYKTNYWNRFLGDNIPGMAQEIATELFDISINMGVHTAVKMIQEGLNILNRNQKDYNDLFIDGVFGEKTLLTLILHLDKEKGDPKTLKRILNALQASKYLSIVRRNPTQEKFIRGWIRRTI